MTTSFVQSLIFLVADIVVIVLLTARYRVRAFFALLIACFIVGLGVGLPVASILVALREGFGRIMQSLGLIVVLGITLGLLLEHSGCTKGGKLLSVLAMGAGSMMISHANDGYFWVISKFSGLDMKAMLKSYSIATIFVGLVTLLVIYFLSLILL